MQTKINRIYSRKDFSAARSPRLNRVYTSVIGKLDHEKLRFSFYQEASQRHDLSLAAHVSNLSRRMIDIYRKNFITLKFNKNPP